MVFEKLRAIIEEITGLDADEITVEATLDDLGLDSLDVVEIIMASEDEFDITIEDDALTGVKTLGDVVDIITDLID
ncbi:MAG: acyl carrier protein [Clostridia bacterium]|nr:acyl carrier protein [Clostridia bacterium]MBR5265051.1 acyl carrier protein [Clostridia bacterium]